MSNPNDQQWVTAEEAQAREDAARAESASSQTGPTQEQIDAQINDAINRALEQQNAKHQEEMDRLLASMRGSVITLVPDHSAGPGTEVAETWSQFEQEQSRAEAQAVRG